MADRIYGADSAEEAYRMNRKTLDKLALMLAEEGCHSFVEHRANNPATGYAAMTFRHGESPEAHVGMLHPESEEDFIEGAMRSFHKWRDAGYPTGRME